MKHLWLGLPYGSLALSLALAERAGRALSLEKPDLPVVALSLRSKSPSTTAGSLSSLLC